MKLLRLGPKGQERPALLDAQGTARDLSGLIDDLTPRHLTPAGLAALRALEPPGLPWSGCGKFICVGLNYADHAAEAGMALPAEPILFSKHLSCMVGAQDPVVLP